MDAAEDGGRKTLPHLAPRDLPNRSVLIYVTQVVTDRRPLLARQEAVDLLLASWRRATFWLVGRYVIMPDHVHLFCAPGAWPVPPLRQWMAFWRSEVTRRWPWPAEKPVWQKDFFDRQLRSGESYSAKWQYVRENPVRAGLVKEPDAWPWQGDLHPLRWHDEA